jgi:hypothetical protein
MISLLTSDRRDTGVPRSSRKSARLPAVPGPRRGTVADGAGILPAVAGRLAAAGLQVSALALRRPTLEDGFLALTSQAARTTASARPPPPADAPPSRAG